MMNKKFREIKEAFLKNELEVAANLKEEIEQEIKSIKDLKAKEKILIEYKEINEELISLIANQQNAIRKKINQSVDQEKQRSNYKRYE